MSWVAHKMSGQVRRAGEEPLDLCCPSELFLVRLKSGWSVPGAFPHAVLTLGSCDQGRTNWRIINVVDSSEPNKVEFMLKIGAKMW